MDQNDKVRQTVVELLNCKVMIEKANRILTAAEENLRKAEGELVRVIKATGKPGIQYRSRQFLINATGGLECTVFKGLVLEEAAEAEEVTDG